VVLGASILAYLPERIRFISDARQVIFGLVLIIMMNLRPDGLLPRKKREKIQEKRTM
jgi:branched-chain amino acid transport system permease protein